MDKLIFEGQEKDELEVALYRKHPIALGKKFIFYIFTLFIILAAYILIKTHTNWLDDNTSLLFMVLVIFAGLYVLFTLLFLFHAWVDYYLDLLIITNERIINIRQEGLFHRSVSELRLYRIQDVTSEIKGFIATIFKYGKVEIQTASGEGRFIFDQVPRPEIVAQKIMQLHEKYVEEKGLIEKTDSFPDTESPNSQNQQKNEIKSV